MGTILSKFARLDWWIIGAIIILQTISIVMMYGIDPASIVQQVLYTVVAFGLLFSTAFVNYKLIQNYAYFIYLFGAVLLIGVLLFGITINGTTGWYQIGPITFQPVELAKIILIIVLARYCSDHAFEFHTWKTIGIAFGIVAGYGGLVLVQPDLGSMVVFTIAFFGILLLTTIRFKQIMLIIGAGCILLAFGWVTVLQDYQKERILTFIDPARDPLGRGYNVTQSIISVGSGQWFGRGLGLGTQSQLQFLPERETDFIFAVIAEELGFLGSMIVILLLSVIIWRLWIHSRRTHNGYAVYYYSGIALLIFTQSVINIGMNIGIMPATGVPLPFISAGGSSLLSLMIGIGIAQNCYAQQK